LENDVESSIMMSTVNISKPDKEILLAQIYKDIEEHDEEKNSKRMKIKRFGRKHSKC
jgi:hypothetical protein